MRVLLIEDDSATAQSIELMLKSENFNVYTTDLGEEGVDLGKLYDYVSLTTGTATSVANAERFGREIGEIFKRDGVDAAILTST